MERECECSSHGDAECAAHAHHEATDVIIGGGFDELDYAQKQGGTASDLSTREFVICLSVLAVVVFGLVFAFR